MDQEKIDSVVDSAFKTSLADWEKCSERLLFPSMFRDDYGWYRVKTAIIAHDSAIKKAFKESLSQLLADE